MSKAFITEVIRQSTAVSSMAANRAAGDLVRAIVKEMKKTGKFALSSFGTFTVHRTRKAVNLRTGEAIRVKAEKTVRFKASLVLRKAV